MIITSGRLGRALLLAILVLGMIGLFASAAVADPSTVDDTVSSSTPTTMSSISTVPDPDLPEDVDVTVPADTTVGGDTTPATETTLAAETTVPVATSTPTESSLGLSTTTETSEALVAAVTSVPTPSVIHAGGGGTAGGPGVGAWALLTLAAGLAVGLLVSAFAVRHRAAPVRRHFGA